MNDCEFEQRGVHSWYCTVHDVEITFGHTEPVSCNLGSEYLRKVTAPVVLSPADEDAISRLLDPKATS